MYFELVLFFEKKYKKKLVIFLKFTLEIFHGHLSVCLIFLELFCFGRLDYE